MIDHVNHIIQIKPQTPVTASNFQEQMEARLKPFEGCQLSSDIKAQIYLTVQQLCMEVLRSLDWVPGDMADFWGGPRPKWAELPRRIRAAWCFAAADASQYLKN